MAFSMGLSLMAFTTCYALVPAPEKLKFHFDKLTLVTIFLRVTCKALGLWLAVNT